MASFGLLVVLGLVSLVAGAELLVRGASRAASALGISPLVIGLTVVAFGTSSPELAASVRAGLAGASDLSVGNVVGSNVFNVLVIGLTVVAAGTSLPELATSAVAAVRGHRDIAVGNVVGSNIFNLLSVLGVTAVVSPGGIAFSDRALGRDLPVMVVVALACLPVFFAGLVVSRWEGGLLLAGYAAYAGWLVVRARGGDADPAVRTSLIVMVVAVVAVTLVVGIARALRRRRLAGRG